MLFEQPGSIKNHVSDLRELPLCDLMFIDTWHVYAHLKRELVWHESKVRKYIVLHDTTVDGVDGEALRTFQDIPRLASMFNYSVAEISVGLWPAVEEFLVSYHGTWELARRYTNNNGLTVLKRRGARSAEFA